MNKTFAAFVVVSLAALIGCSGRPSIIPNKDKSLRKSSAEFAADAAKRHPYPADAPRGGEAVGRATVGYTLNQLDVVNLSKEAWNDVEIWVNKRYVVGVPKIEAGKLRTINFQMLYDDKGRYFPLNNNKVLVDKVELHRDGKIYDIPAKLGD